MTSDFNTCAGCGLPFAECACPPQMGSTFARLTALPAGAWADKHLNLWPDERDRSQVFGFLREPAYSNEEPWQLVANRQTGRTSRMVRAAVEAARSGLSVTVLTLNQQHEHELRRRFNLPNEVRTLAATSHEFSRQYERDLKMWLRREPGRLRLVDPAVIETECHVLLRELHRFDAGYPDWVQTMRQREHEKRSPFDGRTNIRGIL